MNQWIKLSVSMLIGTILGLFLIWIVEGTRINTNDSLTSNNSEKLSETTNF